MTYIGAQTTMRWTSEFPKTDGHYWLRLPNTNAHFAEVVEIQGEAIWMQRNAKASELRRFDGCEFLGPITPAQAEMWDDLLHALLHARNRNYEHAPDACTGCEMVDALLSRTNQLSKGDTP